MNRIVLGTAQLGLAYGTNRDQGIMSDAQVHALLETAWDSGIRAFDTAEAYGSAAERLAAWLRRRGRLAAASVVTKVQTGVASNLPNRVRAALARFDGAAQLTLLAHGFIDGSDWSALRDAAALVGAVAGESVYTADEVRAAVNLSGIARMQAPGNIFDGRALAARGDAPVPIDLRSVYLQGVLLESPDAARARVPLAAPLAEAVESAAREVGADRAELLVAAMLRRLSPGDRLVIGIDRPEQLAELTRGADLSRNGADLVEGFVRSVKRRAPDAPSEDVLDPRRWSQPVSRQMEAKSRHGVAR